MQIYEIDEPGKQLSINSSCGQIILTYEKLRVCCCSFKKTGTILCFDTKLTTNILPMTEFNLVKAETL